VGVNISTSISLSASRPSDVLTGQNAKWILKDDSIGDAEAPFSDYGAIFFYDCNAGTQKSEANLTGATLVNMVQGTATLSTAIDVNTNLFHRRVMARAKASLSSSGASKDEKLMIS
jgi:hypothetical protein